MSNFERGQPVWGRTLRLPRDRAINLWILPAKVDTQAVSNVCGVLVPTIQETLALENVFGENNITYVQQGESHIVALKLQVSRSAEAKGKGSVLALCYKLLPGHIAEFVARHFRDDKYKPQDATILGIKQTAGRVLRLLCIVFVKSSGGANKLEVEILPVLREWPAVVAALAALGSAR